MSATDATVSLLEGVEVTSSGLLRRMRLGDRNAWARFVDLYSPLLYRWCRQEGLQDADAGDVAQEVFRATARSIDSFQHSGAGSFRGWLHKIARNKVIDLRRGQPPGARGAGGSTNQQAMMELAESAAPSEPNSQVATDAGDDLLLLARALDAVLADSHDRTRRAFWMLVIDRRPAAEVAAELGVSPNTVYLAKSRVMRRLRREFDGLIDL